MRRQVRGYRAIGRGKLDEIYLLPGDTQIQIASCVPKHGPISSSEAGSVQSIPQHHVPLPLVW